VSRDILFASQRLMQVVKVSQLGERLRAMAEGCRVCPVARWAELSVACCDSPYMVTQGKILKVVSEREVESTM